jgi:hypothetical protein
VFPFLGPAFLFLGKMFPFTNNLFPDFVFRKSFQ